jgi:hypothetical protein
MERAVNRWVASVSANTFTTTVRISTKEALGLLQQKPGYRLLATRRRVFASSPDRPAPLAGGMGERQVTYSTGGAA